MKLPLAGVVAIVGLAIAIAAYSRTLAPDAPTGGALDARPSASVEAVRRSPTSADPSGPRPVATPAITNFPTREPGTSSMAAEARGTLFDAGGCLWILTEQGNGYGIVWPYGYRWSIEDTLIQVHDEQGTIVATVGAPVRIGGGPAVARDMGCLGAVVWMAAEPIRSSN